MKIILALAACLHISCVAFAAEAGKAREPNRLAAEASPYLRQHAYNPVDWYPWGEVAFDKARKENKPIFLSVGYATCHWCHVMARESFENEEIARLLNENVISIKVDRERHPEVDQIYMLATELIAQHGGWPNSVLLTPDLKPFFASTYLPPDEFRGIIERIAVVWKAEQAALEADGEKVSALIRRIMSTRIAASPPKAAEMQKARDRLLTDLDTFNGGLGVVPKFPREPHLITLLHFAERDNDKRALEAALLTLDHILRGGIHDQVGGGFHRYAVDNAWTVPHFEKMAYNQALMADALVRAWRISGEDRYEDAARRTFDLLLREMTSPQGGFYSALDAETDGKEGAYYLWTPQQLHLALGEDAQFAIDIFGVTEHGQLDGANVLHMPAGADEFAKRHGLDLAELGIRLDAIRLKLLSARDKRVRPKRDEKILTAWNGAMIRALAAAGEAFRESRFIEAAEKAAEFVWHNLRTSDGELLRSYFEGQADLPASQNDYAHLALGLVELYDTTGNRDWLARAIELAEIMWQRFADDDAGDLYMTADQQGFVRMKSREDGELPSGNAAALELFAKLAKRHKSPEWSHRADRLAAALSGLALTAPVTYAYTLAAMDVLHRGETGAIRSGGKGAVRVTARRRQNTLLVEIDIAPGWHVNSAKPLDDLLIPTRLSLGDVAVAAIDYPEPIRRKLGFSARELSLYEGRVLISAPVSAGPKVSSRAVLEFQPCSDRICLDPEKIELPIPPVRAPK
ncbi:MAG: DUF255 domain-containing protein [Hyphomicrobiaceae bacterium]|nr:DUF255 domain-containing protein [Hyphomicrobiaceae bacterium]